MQRGTIIRLSKADPRLDCAYAGQTGEVCRVLENGGLYVVLKCGHPLTLPAGGPDGHYEIVSEPAMAPARDDNEKPEGETMAKRTSKTAKAPEEQAVKQAVIPNSKGIIPVQGYEAQVKRFKTNLKFFEQLEGQIDEDKGLFRGLAAQVVENTTGEVRRVEFLADDGSVVPVSLPDLSKAGNRTSIKPELAAELVKLGVDLGELDVLESETTIVLSGPFVDWFRQNVLQPNYVAHGLPIPAGIEEKTTTRLSETGITKLQAMAKEAKTEQEREAAKLVLQRGIKAAAVTAK